MSAAVALSKIFDIYLDFKTSDRKYAIKPAALLAKLIVSGSFIFYLYLFVFHSTWVTRTAYSSPSVVLPSQTPDGKLALIDDFREAYYWLRMNSDEDSKVAAWWDYGYQIGGMADRTTLVDNNTWNNTHIAIVGKAMASPEEKSYEILKEHDVDYVLVIFGGLIGFGGDDINKFLWMIRISEGIWPEEIKERDFYTAEGEYRVDARASETMRNSLLYKMSYKDFPQLFNGGQATDRVRQQMITPLDVPPLDYFDEVFTSENWMVRIYQLKKDDAQGRTLRDVGELTRSSTKTRRSIKRPELGLRV